MRDALAYLKIVASPDNDLAFERIINTPKRGIGDTSVKRMHAIARQQGLGRSEVMAIGDNHNDLPMLRFAGTGVVMANAEEELRQMEFAVNGSNAEDGVAVAIERYIFNNRTQGDAGQ